MTARSFLNTLLTFVAVFALMETCALLWGLLGQIAVGLLLVGFTLWDAILYARLLSKHGGTWRAHLGCGFVLWWKLRKTKPPVVNRGMAEAQQAPGDSTSAAFFKHLVAEGKDLTPDEFEQSYRAFLGGVLYAQQRLREQIKAHERSDVP